jgi:ABC-type multidrug transport system fused ATPase/permease subunit
MRRLLAGRTAVVIAHRLSTLRWADRIVILEDGRVCEQGTYERLAADPASRLATLLRHGVHDFDAAPAVATAPGGGVQ